MKKMCWIAMAAVVVVVVSFVGLTSFSAPASAGNTLVVDPDGHGSASDCGASNVAYTTIQAAIDAANPGDVISVCPGTYNQDEANGRNPDTGGAGSNDFNIFVNKAVTIQGVDASGTPITNYKDVAAKITAKRNLPTFGADAIFVQADDVTITGLDVTGWSAANNKTVESVGNNLTMKYNKLHGMDGAAALYFDDRHFVPPSTSHVERYDIEANLIDGGGPDVSGIRFSSGAGWSGDVIHRVIADNTFDNNCDAIAFVGPQADPWDVYPVGAATITGNSFSRSAKRHVVAWGKYAGNPGYANLNWHYIVDHNTFDKGAITWTPGGDAQPWTSDPFFDVRGIYSAIQRYAVNKAQNGDTIEVLPGLYPETLNIESFSNLSIVGDDRDTVIVKPASTLPWNVGSYGTSRQAAVRVVSSTGVTLSDMTFDFDSVKGNNVAGLLIWDSTGAVNHNVLKNMSVPDASGGYNELTSYVRAPSYKDEVRAQVAFNNNEFRETGRIGIITHDFVNATIYNNTFTKTTNDFGYAMEIGSQSTATVTDNTISGYDTPAASDNSSAAGIYVENSFTAGLHHVDKPVTISGNSITGNQWGLWIGNDFPGYAGDTDINVTLQGNTISDNTDGGLFIDDVGRSGGSSVTLNATGNAVTNNGMVGYWFNTFGDGELHVDVGNDTITGHDYGVIMTDYPSGTSNSLYDVSVNLSDLSGNTVGVENDVAGQMLDATGNWWGDASGPYNATSNSDGTGAEVIGNVAYSPWLGIGTDSSGDTGFQLASPMTFIVEPQVCLPIGCIQQAIDLASAGDTISVYSGTYNQDEANGRDPDAGGAGNSDFNIFVNKALTIQGVDASGDPITDYDDVAAFVSPKRNMGTGNTDAIFVQADDVTITGLDVTGWTGAGYEDNKTLESIGDNLTVKYSQLHGVNGAAALYMYDSHFVPPSTSHVQSYDIEANLLDGGAPPDDAWGNGIRISSGAGWSGDVSGRVIKNNTFDNNCDGIEFVGPGGDSWDVYPVGAATITGNSFSNSDRRHVIAWGEYADDVGYGDLDWHAILSNNTFDKGSAVWTSGGAPRTWESQYTDDDGTHVFKNTVGIYSAIQRYAIDRVAQSGDTVQVLPGMYNENVSISKPLILQGTSKPIIDGGAAADAVNVSANGVTIDGFEIRNGYNGILLSGVSGAVISNNEIHHNVNLLGNAGVGILFWGDNDNNQILNNVIHDNDRQGLIIGDCDFAGPLGECTTAGTSISSGNTISGNKIYNNGLNETGPPDASRYGIQLWNANNNTIEKNEIYGHAATPGWSFALGIYLCAATNTAVNTNVLHDNEYNIGIYACDGSSAGTSIFHNSITSAGNTGIRVWSNAATVVASLNIISGNASYGVRNTDSTGDVDARGNWWGDATGPYHPTKNPGGLGDDVSDYVLFDAVPDNCPAVYNPDQTNTDAKPIDNGPVVEGDDLTVPNADLLGDACDPDDDNDWMQDTGTSSLGVPGEDVGCNGSGPTNPLKADSDGDTVVDGAECLLRSNPNNPLSKPSSYPANDADGDGLPASIEALFGSNPNNSDTDGDGIDGGIEVRGWGTSPILKDTDGDGCDDNIEIADVNGDGKVMVGDLYIIAVRAAKVADDDFDTDPPWDFSPAFDLTKDGKIMVGDIYIVAVNSGKRCP